MKGSGRDGDNLVLSTACSDEIKPPGMSTSSSILPALSEMTFSILSDGYKLPVVLSPSLPPGDKGHFLSPVFPGVGGTRSNDGLIGASRGRAGLSGTLFPPEDAVMRRTVSIPTDAFASVPIREPTPGTSWSTDEIEVSACSVHENAKGSMIGNWEMREGGMAE